jgi:type II secretory pathway pseudopilin PulG
MVIILIIAGLMIGVGGSAREAAKKRKAEVMIASLEVAISMYDADTAQYPGQNDTNATLVDNLINDSGVNGWRGPYMEFNERDLNDSNEVVDPWNAAYEYAIMENKDPATDTVWGNDNSYNLWSNGPNLNDDSGDGNHNYGDDIYNW